MKVLLGKSQIAFRKCKSNTTALNAGVLKQQGAVERLIHVDKGFKFLKALRGSPPYFEKAKRDFFAMIRQLGLSTLFFLTNHCTSVLRTQIFKLAGFMLLKSNYCALTAPPKLALYSFSQNLPSLNLQYSNFPKTYS